jgi:hypothetical protein
MTLLCLIREMRSEQDRQTAMDQAEAVIVPIAYPICGITPLRSIDLAAVFHFIHSHDYLFVHVLLRQ